MSMTNPNLRENKFRKIIIAVFCAMIAGCIAYVMFGVYDPARNSLPALSSVCMDVVCIIILFILIGSFAFGNYGNSRTTRLFALLIICTIWAIFLDFLNWAFDGSLVYGGYTYWFTVGSLCMGAVLGFIFSMYLYSYMDEMHSLRNMRTPAYVCAALNLGSFVVTFILALTKKAFNFVDGHYETGILYYLVTAVPVLTLLFITGFCIRYVKQIGIHDVLAVAGYILFMVAGALIESEYSIGTTYVAVAIADIYIFAMLQNEIITTEKRNTEKWMRMSKTDELTGFFNRHAYEEALTDLEVGVPSENLVYVSIDVNSLKTVNDSLGHVAGDELLVGAAECLKKCFGAYGKLFRIGGDEFAAIIYANEVQLELIKKDVEATTRQWKGKLADTLTISCGYASLKEAEITVRNMVILADRRMYEAKAMYYQSTGNERRKN